MKTLRRRLEQLEDAIAKRRPRFGLLDRARLRDHVEHLLTAEGDGERYPLPEDFGGGSRRAWLARAAAEEAEAEAIARRGIT